VLGIAAVLGSVVIVQRAKNQFADKKVKARR
jgi:hypothetical protein